jgi:hypothetical protein
MFGFLPLHALVAGRDGEAHVRLLAAAGLGGVANLEWTLRLEAVDGVGLPSTFLVQRYNTLLARMRQPAWARLDDDAAAVVAAGPQMPPRGDDRGRPENPRPLKRSMPTLAPQSEAVRFAAKPARAAAAVAAAAAPSTGVAREPATAGEHRGATTMSLEVVSVVAWVRTSCRCLVSASFPDLVFV